MPKIKIAEDKKENRKTAVLLPTNSEKWHTFLESYEGRGKLSGRYGYGVARISYTSFKIDHILLKEQKNLSFNFTRYQVFLTSLVIGADQNTGGALLEFSIRTAMHGTSGLSSAISVCHRNKISLCPFTDGVAQRVRR